MTRGIAGEEKKINKNVNDVALIRHLATSNIANFMWNNFLLVKKKKIDATEGTKFSEPNLALPDKANQI